MATDRIGEMGGGAGEREGEVREMREGGEWEKRVESGRDGGERERER